MKFEYLVDKWVIYVVLAILIGYLLFWLGKPNFSVPSTRIKKWWVGIELFIRWFLAISLILFTLNISWVSEKKIIKEPVYNVWILFDVSLSMAAKDISPSRWEVARNTLIKLLKKLKKTNVFVVVYSWRAFVWSPITDNLKALIVKLQLMRLSDFPPTPNFLGTAIWNAILLGIDNILKFADKDHFPPGSLILITDGDSNTGLDPIQAAQLAAKAGIPIFTIGIWAESLPIWRTAAGDVELGGLNKQLLTQIAQITSWDFVLAKSEAQLDEFFDEIVDFLNKNAFYKDKVYIKKSYLNQYLAPVILILVAFRIVILAVGIYRSFRARSL